MLWGRPSFEKRVASSTCWVSPRIILQVRFQQNSAWSMDPKSCSSHWSHRAELSMHVHWRLHFRDWEESHRRGLLIDLVANDSKKGRVFARLSLPAMWDTPSQGVLGQAFGERRSRLERTLTLLRVCDAIYHGEKGETYLVLDDCL